jgi:hypothetical protein
MYGEEFDPYDMSPDDCVRLLNLMNSLIIDEMSQAVEEGSIIDLDRFAVMQKMIDEAGMPFDDIIRFCEIGEYIALDREFREMTEDEAAAWKYKREAVIAMIDTILASAVKAGVVSDDLVEADPSVEMLEEIWKLS